MNTLSWLIYAASVVGNIKGLLIAGAVIGSGTCALSVVVWLASEGEVSPKPILRWLWAPILAAFLAATLPGSQTMYMIAASEAGEQIVTSPDAIEMMGDLKAIIKQRLKDELEAK